MPFDTTTFAPAKADPLDLSSPAALDALIAWLETMPARGRYDYTDASRCLITRFFESRHGSVEPLQEWPPLGYAIDGARVTAPEAWGRVAVRCRTYGSALSRFRALREGK